MNVRWDLDFIRLNLSSRKIREGDTQQQLGESRTQNSLTLDIPSRWGSFGAFARTYQRREGLDQELIEGLRKFLRKSRVKITVCVGSPTALHSEVET